MFAAMLDSFFGGTKAARIKYMLTDNEVLNIFTFKLLEDSNFQEMFSLAQDGNPIHLSIMERRMLMKIIEWSKSGRQTRNDYETLTPEILSSYQQLPPNVQPTMPASTSQILSPRNWIIVLVEIKHFSKVAIL